MWLDNSSTVRVSSSIDRELSRDNGSKYQNKESLEGFPVFGELKGILSGFGSTGEILPWSLPLDDPQEAKTAWDHYQVCLRNKMSPN